MMFPDTANEKQNAALRLTAERSHTAANSPDQYERTMRNVFSTMRDGSSAAQQLARYIAVPIAFHSSTR
jgi:hypothetical protein